MDAFVAERHPEQVPEQNKYWDYRECAWRSCESPLAEIPEQAEPQDELTPAEIGTGGETSSRA